MNEQLLQSPEDSHTDLGTQDEDIVVIKELKKSYQLQDGRDIPVLRNITLDNSVSSFPIKKGEFLIIRGPSGSGKTSLLNIIGTIDKPSSGSLFLFGKEILPSSEDNELAAIRLCHLGFVFQTFNLISTLTSVENVMLPMQLAGKLSKKEQTERAIQLLIDVGLQDRIYHLPSELSGGEQQRVTIARAMANNPELLLLDEPTGDLDSKTTIEVMNILLDLNRKGVTMVMVTHNPDLECYANRILYIHNGLIEKQIINTYQCQYFPEEYQEKVNAK
ncbi:hypothetical protein WA171_005860 [Blastocystis sp. BT1]